MQLRQEAPKLNFMNTFMYSCNTDLREYENKLHERNILPQISS